MRQDYTHTARYWRWLVRNVLPSAIVSCHIDSKTRRIMIKINY